MIKIYLITFLCSLISTYLFIRFNYLHEKFSSDSDLKSPQKIHLKSVPRIGGISILTGLTIAIYLFFHTEPGSIKIINLLMCCIPTFAIGLAEDLTKRVSVKLRLTFTILAALLFIHLEQVHIRTLDIPFLDNIFLIPIIGVAFTLFAITGLTNSYNIIDGFNGLASMLGIMALSAIAYISFQASDQLMIFLSFAMIASILGFFIWNYPRGLIFLGDGGAYLIGFWIASLSIIITNRHQEISPWFFITINIYPIIETLFTIYRRSIFKGKSSTLPDRLHMHTLIYRKIKSGGKPISASLAQSYTSLLLWIFSMFWTILGTAYYQSTPALILNNFLALLSYIFIYKRLLTFKKFNI